MKTFNDHMLGKQIDRLAEKCVREKLPIVEFVQWYEEEGQYLNEGAMGDIGWGGLAGAGVGSSLGPVGTLAGGAIGAGIGAGKYLYNKFSQPRPGYEKTKQDAINALTAFAKMSPPHAKQLNAMVNFLSKGAGSPAGSPTASPSPAGSPTANPSSPLTLKRGYIGAGMKDPLIKDLGDDLIGNLSHNGISVDQFMKAFKANEPSFPSAEEAIAKTLTDLGIRNRAGGYYAWNSAKSTFEHRN